MQGDAGLEGISNEVYSIYICCLPAEPYTWLKHMTQTKTVRQAAKKGRVIMRSSGFVANGFSVEVKLHALGNRCMYMSFDWKPFQPTDAEIDSFGEEYDAILAPVFAAAFGTKCPPQTP